jgi:cytochrome oxidase Cu insertion factor (SCO1/SenC/PrrC family)
MRLRIAAGLLACACVLSAALDAAHAAEFVAAPVAASTRSAAELMDVVMWNREPIGGPFALTDTQGRLRRDSEFRDRVMLIYFGFTTCPNICPTDLLEIGQALRRLGPSAKQVVPLFITLDPERDTRQLLKAYVPAFHPQLIGLTGTPTDIDRVAEAFKVYHLKVPVEGAMGYTIDHSAYIYIVDRDGRYVGFLAPGSNAERIAAALKPLLPASPR